MHGEDQRKEREEQHASIMQHCFRHHAAAGDGEADARRHARLE